MNDSSESDSSQVVADAECLGGVYTSESYSSAAATDVDGCLMAASTTLNSTLCTLSLDEPSTFKTWTLSASTQRPLERYNLLNYLDH